MAPPVRSADDRGQGPAAKSVRPSQPRPGRMTEPDDEAAYRALHAAGWSVGDCRLVDLAIGGLVWVVSGHRGEDQVRADAGGRLAGGGAAGGIGRAEAVGGAGAWPTL